jgi:hypothetical protein
MQTIKMLTIEILHKKLFIQVPKSPTLGIKFNKTEENCEANTYISVHDHGSGCRHIYYVGVHRVIVAAFPLNFKHLISSKTKFAVTLHSRLTWQSVDTQHEFTSCSQAILIKRRKR